LSDKITETLNKSRERSEAFNETIKELLLYTGFASAVISSIAYIIITFVMVNGFTSDLELKNQITFAIIGAVVGISITISLILQGIAFAKKVPFADKIMDTYYKLVNKTKKEKELHTIDHYIRKAIIQTVIVRGITVALSTFFVLYIFIEGNGNWGLLGLAFANIFMFIGFGLVGLSNAYDFYLKQHIPVIKERIERMTHKPSEEETNEISDIEYSQQTMESTCKT
jgi:hypothetical protein